MGDTEVCGGHRALTSALAGGVAWGRQVLAVFGGILGISWSCEPGRSHLASAT